jgi:hypothetical protein
LSHTSVRAGGVLAIYLGAMHKVPSGRGSSVCLGSLAPAEEGLHNCTTVGEDSTPPLTRQGLKGR